MTFNRIYRRVNLKSDDSTLSNVLIEKAKHLSLAINGNYIRV